MESPVRGNRLIFKSIEIKMIFLGKAFGTHATTGPTPECGMQALASGFCTPELQSDQAQLAAKESCLRTPCLKV